MIKAQQPQSYSAEQKAATTEASGQRKLYRADDQPSRPVNIMYDRRIYRGNTYASPVLPAYAQPDAVELQRQQLARRKLRAARRAEAARRPRTPDAIEGRTHMEVQTELYLEELGDTVPEANVATQTDAFLDRAPSPLYIPAKSGIDAATQILEGDLFDFDEEVEPLLEVLVGKTLDRARAEVVQEAELAALRKRQRDFAARRAAEMAEVQRLEQAEVRRVEEKKRRVAEAERLLKEKSEAAKKVAAASFAQVYLSSLVPTTLQGLEEEGFFYDTREREIQQMFLPWLTAQVDQRVLRVSAARSIIDELIAEALKRKTFVSKPKSEVVVQPIEVSKEQQPTPIAIVEVAKPATEETEQVLAAPQIQVEGDMDGNGESGGEEAAGDKGGDGEQKSEDGAQQ